MAGIYSPHDSIIGVQSATGGRGGGMRYLLRDEFTTDRAAGAVNGTAAEPGGGTRVAVDTNSKLTIASGLLTFATGGAGASDPGYWLDSVARAAGRVLVAQVTPANTNGSAGIGWDSNQSGAINDAMQLAASGALNVVANSGTAYAVGTYTAASLKVAAAMRATGVYWFVYIGGQWILKAITAAGTGAGYPAIVAIGTTSIFTSDYLRVPTAKWLPTPLLSDGFGSAFGTSDGLGHAEGVAGGIGAGGSGVALSNAGGTWSVSGGKAINTPSVGAELLTNGDFSAWTGDNPDGWTVVGESGSDPEVSEVGSGESHGGTGTGSANLYTSGGGLIQIKQSSLATIGDWYLYQVAVSAASVGGIAITNFYPVTSLTTVGSFRMTLRKIDNTDIPISRTGVSNATIDSVSVKALTLSELLTLSNLSCADVYAGAAITKSNTYVQAGLALNWDSASSPANGLIVYLSGGNIKVDKCVAGTWTNVSAPAFTYSAGARLVATMNAGALRVYYNGALITTATIVDAGILTGTYHGLFSTDASNTLDDLTVYSTGLDGSYNVLDSYAA